MKRDRGKGVCEYNPIEIKVKGRLIRKGIGKI